MIQFSTNFKMIPVTGPLIHDTETYTAAFKDLGGSYKVDIMRGRTIAALGEHIEGVLASVPNSIVLSRDELISLMVDVVDDVTKGWYDEVLGTDVIKKSLRKMIYLEDDTEEIIKMK